MKYDRLFVLLMNGEEDCTFRNEQDAIAYRDEYRKVWPDRTFEVVPRYRKPTGKYCPHCGGPVYRSDLPQYRYQCFDCDEDFFVIEVLSYVA